MIKKSIVLLILIFSINASSQEYKPLIDNLNEWHFTTCYFGCLTDVYYTDGDTLVNEKTYKILDGYHYNSRTFLIREEIENKKIFMAIVNETNITEYLLYDFSLAEGEEINMYNPISPFPEDGGVFVVDSIRLRELADTNEYRHFYFSPIPSNTISTENCIWVEGVGSMSIINAPGGKPDINEVGNLSCFFKNTELFYSNLDSIDDCEPIHLGVSKSIRNLSEVEIYTTNKKSNLINTSNVTMVNVYSIAGKLMTSEINFERNKLITLDLTTLISGVYIIVAYTTNNTKITFKIVL